MCVVFGFVAACWERATLPESAIPFSPPSVYAHWWAMTEQCSGLAEPMTDISWYQVPGVSAFSAHDTYLAGEWLSSGNRIVLADSASGEGALVRHEMLHALLQRGGHDREYFLGRCAGVVSCLKECVADAGPASVAPAPLVTPESLEVSATADPVRPSVSIDEGYFTVTVTARNTAAHPVMLPATSAYNGPAQTFWLHASRAGGRSRRSRAGARFVRGVLRPAPVQGPGLRLRDWLERPGPAASAWQLFSASAVWKPFHHDRLGDDRSVTTPAGSNPLVPIEANFRFRLPDRQQDAWCGRDAE